ncbi:MAG: 7TM domain-containing protein [Gammaproteobacteria bacterium]
MVLLAIAALPLLISIARISAWPGVLSPGVSGTLLPSLGHELGTLSLRNISPSSRNHILYLLFVPTGAVLIALARLTFGIRVIGFRSILISVGFQQSGILPSLLLIATMALIVITIRPVLLQLRLPYYAHVAVIMSFSVMLLLGAVILAPWFNSEILWGLATFPVIVLGLLAEGIGKTIDRDSGLTAAWRTGMTIVIALILAGISQVTVLREIAIEFPELIVTQIVMIILISEFLDLRLLQDWDAKLSGLSLPKLFSDGSALRVAIVHNKTRTGFINRLGASSRGGYKNRNLRRIATVLRASGHTIKLFEGDMTLLARLEKFIPQHPMSGQPGGIVFNLAHGIQGEAAVAHVPAMLEMAGLAYTGPTPQSLLISLDRMLAQSVLCSAGIATPDSWIVGEVPDERRSLPYPVVIKPRAALGHKLRVASNRDELLEAVRKLAMLDVRECIVQPYIAGREFDVAIIGNTPASCLPLVEVVPANAGNVCPAAVNADLAEALRTTALAAFRICGCRDYACINIRVSTSGQPVVIEVETAGVLSQGGSFELAAAAAGLSFNELVNAIIDVARQRYRQPASGQALEVVPLHGREVARSGSVTISG